MPRTLVIVLLMLLACACGSTGKKQRAPVADLLRTSSIDSGPTTLQPGDEIEVVFYHTPELNVAMPVRPDGTIGVPLCGQVVAANRTPEEIARILEQRCADELRDPVITVVVAAFTSRRVHVGGEVDKPGVVELTGRLTLLDALFAAGGPLATGELEQTLLIRYGQGEDAPTVYVANLERALSGKDPAQNVAILPYDIIYLPRSRIANINVWVDQYIRENIPVSIGFRPEFSR